MAATAVSSSPLPSSNTGRRRPPSQFNLSSCSSLHADHLRWRPQIHAVDGLVSSWKPASTATSTSATIRSEWRDPSSDEMILPERKKNVIGNRRSAWSTAPGGVEDYEGGGKVRRRVACRAVGRGEVGYNVVPERVKVAAMVALVMCLCNADRVVMSVAVVPLAVRYGWSNSFLGIVQGYYVLLSWMAVYFRTVFGVDLKQAAWFSAVPWGLMGLSGYVAGAASDKLIRSGHPVTRVRKIMQSIGFFGPGVALLCLNFAQTPAAAVVLLTAALSLSSFSQAGFFLTVQDIAPKHVGFLHGISNAMGTLGAIISTTTTGYFVQWLGSFQATLTITAVLYFAAAIFWNIFATAEQVFF